MSLSKAWLWLIWGGIIVSLYFIIFFPIIGFIISSTLMIFTKHNWKYYRNFVLLQFATKVPLFEIHTSGYKVSSIYISTSLYSLLMSFLFDSQADQKSECWKRATDISDWRMFRARTCVWWGKFIAVTIFHVRASYV